MIQGAKVRLLSLDGGNPCNQGKMTNYYADGAVILCLRFNPVCT